jgi:hypothetical protein
MKPNWCYLAFTLLLPFTLANCGVPIENVSGLDVEINPTGQEDHHFFGIIKFEGKETAKYPDVYDAEDSPRYEIEWSTINEDFAEVYYVPTEDGVYSEIKVLEGNTIYAHYKQDQLYYSEYLEMKPDRNNFVMVIPRLRRIDVNHMLITRQNGSKYFAPGEYTVYMVDEWGSDEFITSGQTQTGLDVLDGFTYLVRVEATDEQDQVTTEEFTVDFTKNR